MIRVLVRPCVCVSCDRYVQLVDLSAMVYLQDSKDTVLSLPPITNCEESKVRKMVAGKVSPQTMPLRTKRDSN